MKVAIHTLGCKVNQYETQALERELEARGHVLTKFTEPADVYIVNTCTVTAVSDKKSRQAIRQAKARNPGALMAVCGCYAQTDPEAVTALGADFVAGTGDRAGFVDKLEGLYRDRKSSAPLMALDDPMGRRVFELLPAGGLEGRTRAMLKVEDGCVNFCSYCIIPYARGPVRSLPLTAAVSEARRLAAEGFREIVLTGIEISSYGRDFKDGAGLIELTEAVCAAAPELRVRLGSLEPRTVAEEFCARLVRLPNLCPHFHLSLQSGCDGTLKRMNRKYGTGRYLESVNLLRAYFGRPGITADLITGFPGETEAEFGETLAFLEACAFSAMHIFPYSRRPGTPAASMPGQVPRGVKEERARRAAALATRLERAYLASWVGQALPVLFEEEKEGLWRGHAPNYVQVRAQGAGLHNRVRQVRITGVGEDCLEGELL
jgi:threonylcarbamoyladenosine tRNA methylthiotransferase MtaB